MLLWMEKANTSFKDNIAISNGAACTQQKREKAMFYRPFNEEKSGVIRLSWSHLTRVEWETLDEIFKFLYYVFINMIKHIHIYEIDGHQFKISRNIKTIYQTQKVSECL